MSCTIWPSRKEFLLQAVAFSPCLIIPNAANSAKGAAELDLEYYARDLFLGNRAEGSVLPSRLPDLPPPRTLMEPLLSLLLREDDSCVPMLALNDILKASDNSTIITKMDYYRDKSRRSFSARATWKEEILSDQYYFDLTSYALWRSAADLLPDFRDRDQFVRNTGRRLFDLCQSQGLFRSSFSNSLTDSLPCMRDILELFTTSHFCKSYRIGEDYATSAVVFDSLDDDALRNGATVNCIVSVTEPATLGASLQITGEQSRFAPDYIGPTLAAMWEECGIQTTWDTFFIDNVYRPNPKDYFPNEQLYQFSLSQPNR